MKMHIAFSCDQNYVRFLAAILASILKNAKDDDEFCFHIFENNLSQSDKNNIDMLLKIHDFEANFYETTFIADTKKDLYIPEEFHFTEAAYVRIFMADILPLDKFLYLDVDMVVLSSLKSLYTTNINDHFFAAVPQFRGEEMSNALRLGTFGHAYFNSGVLLVDAAKWREHSIGQKLLQHAMEIKEKIFWVDQDVLNSYFAPNKYFQLERRWNCEAENAENFPDPCIVHYQGGNKFSFSSSYLLDEYIAITPYKKFPIKSESPKCGGKSWKRKVFEFVWGKSLTFQKVCKKISSVTGSMAQSIPQSSIEHEFVQQAIKYHFPTLKVAYGPFAGMSYPGAEAVGSTIFPKLLGSYEKEIAPDVQRALRDMPDVIIDIGCAEGYYAVGAAISCPEAKIFAYDQDSDARALCRAMAEQNGVAGRLVLGGKCSDPQHLLSIPQGRKGLFFCDCEGFEKKLLTKAIFEHFRVFTFIIEIHDCFDAEISGMVSVAAQGTHTIRTVFSVSDRDKAIYYTYPETAFYDLTSRQVLLAERRPESMKWFIATPK